MLTAPTFGDRSFVPSALPFAVLTLMAGSGEARTRPSRALAAANELNLRATLRAVLSGQQAFTVSSATFRDNGFIPASMVFSGQLGSVCTGGNESPELSWTQAPGNVGSYALVLFDVTASFTHWGMYNIPATTTEVPENAGVAGSTFGAQC